MPIPKGSLAPDGGLGFCALGLLNGLWEGGRMRLVLGGMLVAWWPIVAPSQQTVTVDGRPECPACTIIHEEIATLQGIWQGKPLTLWEAKARDHQGRWYVTTLDKQIAVFRANGTVEAVLGRPGRGPGEFTEIPLHLAVGPGDSIYVFDAVGARATVYGPTLRLARSFIIPTAQNLSPSTALLTASKLVVQLPLMTRERIGIPYHVMNTATGGIERSFGEDSTAVRPGSLERFRVLRPAGDTAHIWTAYFNRYTIERWDVDRGVREFQVTRAVDWFKPGGPYGEDARKIKPNTQLVDLWYDGENARLWVLLRVAARDWEQHHADKTYDYSKLRENVVEVIDLRTNRLITSQRVPDRLHYFLNATTYSVRDDESDVPIVRIRRFALRGDAGRAGTGVSSKRHRD
jgi:hypothetical protein